MKWVFTLAAWLIAMFAISGAPSAASVAITADLLIIGGCSSNRAIGGGAVGLYCAGDIHGSVDFPTSGGGGYQIGIVARGDTGWGVVAPQARISIDGAAIGTITITTSSFSTYTTQQCRYQPREDVSISPLPTATAFRILASLYTFRASAITSNARRYRSLPAASPTSADAYQQQLLNLINGSRAGAGLSPLTLSAVQSAGTASCIGSYGHSVHMAQVGQIATTSSRRIFAFPVRGWGECRGGIG